MRVFYALIVAAASVSSDIACAGFVDDSATFALAISVLRGAIGQHARALRIEADVNGIEIDAQDPHNLNHINGWRYGTVTYMGVPLRRLTGPEALNPALINPDIEANLFDLDSIDFAAAPKLIQDAITRAHLQDAASVTGMEIARQTFILPEPTSGEVRWTVHVDSGRERADIFANAQGLILGADVSGTQRAKTLNIFKEPDLTVDAAEAFRDVIGAGRVLTRLGIDKRTISFSTNIPDKSRLVTSSMPVTETFTWDLNGLQRRLGSIDVTAQTGMPQPAAFSISDVDWTILGRLEDSAIEKAGIPKSLVTHLGIAASTEQPGQPVLLWTVDVTDADGEVTKVIADLKGVITRVVLPESRRPKIDWREPAALAGAIAQIGSVFGPEVMIASIAADDREARITIDDPTRGGKPPTFEFSADSVTRATISFFVLRLVFAGVMDVAFVGHVFAVDPYDFSAHPASLQITRSPTLNFCAMANVLGKRPLGRRKATALRNLCKHCGGGVPKDNAFSEPCAPAQERSEAADIRLPADTKTYYDALNIVSRRRSIADIGNPACADVWRRYHVDDSALCSVRH